MQKDGPETSVVDSSVSVITKPVQKSYGRLKPDVDLLVKYRPTHVQQILGNKTAIDALVSALRHPSSEDFAYFVYGPPGVGKTLALKLVCEDLGLRVIDLNASLTLTKQNLQKLLHCVMFPAFFDTSVKNVVIIDEPESIDAGGLPFLNEFLKDLRKKGISTPFVFVTSDPAN